MFFRCITPAMDAVLNSAIIEHLPSDTYLAGGTAIALYHGHRLSVDLDFFTPKAFDSLILAEVISKALKSDFKVSKNNIVQNTLVLNLNGAGFSVFKYPYPLLNKTVSVGKPPIRIASQLDLALMKMIAINQRGTCKDFIDLKCLIKANDYKLNYLIEKMGVKYDVGREMEMQMHKSLVYFEDAERDLNILVYNEKSKKFEMLKREDWKSIQSFFSNFIMKDDQLS